MSMSKSGVNIIDRGAGGGFPMSQRAGMYDDECDECGSKNFYPDPATGAQTCVDCGKQEVGAQFDTSLKNWDTEESGGGSRKGKRAERIGSVRDRNLSRTRPAGDALKCDSQKVRDIKEELDRIVNEEDARRITKRNVDILNTKQNEFLTAGGSRRHLLIGVGMRPAIVNTFCVASAIVIRHERDKAGDGRAFGATELLERVKGEYCDDDGLYVFTVPGETYRLDPSRSHPGMGKTLMAMISEYCVNLDKIWPPEHKRMKRMLGRSVGAEAKGKMIEMMKEEQRKRVRRFLGDVGSTISKGAISGYVRIGGFNSFKEWCNDDFERTDVFLQKNAKKRTQKIFSYLVAAEFLECETPAEIVRMMGVSGGINNPTKENMKQMMAAWRGNPTEGDISESEGGGS